MPSEHQPADRHDPDRPYDVARMKERIGEDPGRFLDRDLYDHGVRRLEAKARPEWNGGNQKLVRDTDVSTPGELIRDRIRGIDFIETARAWQAVERALERTPDGGRDVVIDLLEERIAVLEDEGERELPDLSAEERRERAAKAFEAVAPKGKAIYRGLDGEETVRSKGQTATGKLHAMRADGGDSA